jgi:hypothetical protein
VRVTADDVAAGASGGAGDAVANPAALALPVMAGRARTTPDSSDAPSRRRRAAGQVYTTFGNRVNPDGRRVSPWTVAGRSPVVGRSPGGTSAGADDLNGGTTPIESPPIRLSVAKGQLLTFNRTSPMMLLRLSVTISW